MPPVARSISLPARSGLVGAPERAGSIQDRLSSIDVATISPWPAPDPAARVFWLAAPAEYAADIRIVDDAVWGPPVLGTAVSGIPAPDLAGPASIPATTPVASSGHGRRLLAAIGAAIVAAAGGLALVIALV